jgi:hypothetical protein
MTSDMRQPKSRDWLLQQLGRMCGSRENQAERLGISRRALQNYIAGERQMSFALEQLVERLAVAAPPRSPNTLTLEIVRRRRFQIEPTAL